MTGHTAIITVEGPVGVTHPADDHDGCDFEDYLAQDWSDTVYLSSSETGFGPPLLGPRKFIWVVTEAQSYWNSTPITD